jgi:hypothetical protein
LFQGETVYGDDVIVEVEVDEGYESDPGDWLVDPDVDPEDFMMDLMRDQNPLPPGDGRDGGGDGDSASDTSRKEDWHKANSVATKNAAQRVRGKGKAKEDDHAHQRKGKSDVAAILTAQAADAAAMIAAEKDALAERVREAEDKRKEEARAKVIRRNGEIDAWRRKIASRGLVWYSQVGDYMSVAEPVDQFPRGYWSERFWFFAVWASLLYGVMYSGGAVRAWSEDIRRMKLSSSEAFLAAFVAGVVIAFFLYLLLGFWRRGKPHYLKHHVTFHSMEEDDTELDRRRDAFSHVELRFPANYMRMRWVVRAFDKFGLPSTIDGCDEMVLFNGLERVSFSLMHLAYYVNHKPNKIAMEKVAMEMKRIGSVNIDSAAMENAVGIASMALAAVWMSSLFALRHLHRGVDFADGVVPGLALPRFF